MYIFRNLKHLMKVNNLTQEALAEGVGIIRSTICAWIDARQLEPSIPHLKKLSDYFKVSIDYLCMEDITVMDKREILNNYNQVQKRLK